MFWKFFIYSGGLEDEKYNNPARELNEINLLDLFSGNTNVLNKLNSYFNKKNAEKNNNEITQITYQITIIIQTTTTTLISMVVTQKT